MNQNKVTKIAHLLSQAGGAHHTFEQTVLKGVYDEAWPMWYADYVVERGLAELLGRAVTAEQVSRFFTESYAVYQAENIKQGWTDYTAEQMVEARLA